MAGFNIPGSNMGGSDSGPFLGRLQYDARSGFFTRVDRTQDADGGWSDDVSEPFRNPVFAFDAGSMEAGYIKFASPPAFLLTPFLGAATAWPQQPEEMAPAKTGEKPKRAFMPGVRIKVMSAKTFGDGEPRYFSATSKSLLGAIEEVVDAFMAAPEAREGKIPVIEHTTTKTIETKTPKGTTKNYAPVFVIKQWIARPEGFGDRTVPAPVGAAPAATPAPVAPAPTFVPARVPAMAGAGGGKSSLDDDIPFAPEHR